MHTQPAISATAASPGLLRGLLEQFPAALFLVSLDPLQILYTREKSSSTPSFDFAGNTTSAAQPFDFSPTSLEWHRLVEAAGGDERGISLAGFQFSPRELRLHRIHCDGREYIFGLAREDSGAAALREAVIEERNKLDALMSALGDGITVQDRGFRILYQNRAHKEKQGDHMGEICYQAYQHRDSVCDGCLVAKCFEDGQIHRRQAVAKTGHHDLYMEVTCSPMKNSRGEIVAGVEAVRDISEQKRLEIFKDELISSISHEMSTPLTALLGFTEFLLDNRIDEKERNDYLQIMLAEGGRLQDLIENLLLFQQLRLREAGCLRIETIPVRALLEILEKAFPDLASGRHVLSVDCPKKIGAIQGDWEKLARALKNLLANAIKYSPHGGSIRLRAAVGEAGEVVISVEDQGLGIPAEYHERIFERFFQYAHAEQSKMSGVGLGLALVRDIVEAHHGRVWVESSPGTGSRFCMALPRENEVQK